MEVLNTNERETIESKTPDYKKNECLLRILDKKGTEAQKIFYQILQTEDPYLVKDPERDCRRPNFDHLYSICRCKNIHLLQIGKYKRTMLSISNLKAYLKERAFFFFSSSRSLPEKRDGLHMFQFHFNTRGLIYKALHRIHTKM